MNAASNLRWAFNSATVMNCEWDEEFALWEKYGWRSVEVWNSKMEKRLERGGSYETLRLQMRDVGIAPVGLCVGCIGTQAQNVSLEDQASSLAKHLDVAAAIGSPSLTLILVGAVSDNLADDYDFAVERLRAASEQAAQRGILLNLEFLGKASINGTLGSGIELVNRVNHPSLGLLFDLCHYYASASHLEELSQLPPEKLFMVHVDDACKVPMESLRNDQRTFLGEGRIDVPGMLHRLKHEFGYNGHNSIELYDSDIWKLPVDEVFARTAQSIESVEARLTQLEHGA